MVLATSHLDQAFRSLFHALFGTFDVVRTVYTWHIIYNEQSFKTFKTFSNEALNGKSNICPRLSVIASESECLALHQLYCTQITRNHLINVYISLTLCSRDQSACRVLPPTANLIRQLEWVQFYFSPSPFSWSLCIWLCVSVWHINFCMRSVSFTKLEDLTEAEQARQDALDLRCLQVSVVNYQLLR